MSTVLEREMTITHSDFMRLLPKAISGLRYGLVDGQIEIKDEEKTVWISLKEESVRKIASLVLPLTFVRIELLEFSPADLDRFMRRFDLAYQKGGG